MPRNHHFHDPKDGQKVYPTNACCAKPLDALAKKNACCAGKPFMSRSRCRSCRFSAQASGVPRNQNGKKRASLQTMRKKMRKVLGEEFFADPLGTVRWNRVSEVQRKRERTDEAVRPCRPKIFVTHRKEVQRKTIQDARCNPSNGFNFGPPKF